MAKQTPLFQRHLDLGATMVDFAGYEMPLQYSSIREEHNSVRERVGLFDLSHMGEVALGGAGATESLLRLVANDVSKLDSGGALYGVFCNPQGGIIDDVIVYRDSDSEYMVVINAACRDKDVAWMQNNLKANTDFRDDSDDTALLAIQGPQAHKVIASLCAESLAAMRGFQHLRTNVAGFPVRLSRTGYTGEDGFELYVANQDALPLWDAIMDAGTQHQICPCGLGARDTLRLEAGLRLYGQDMDDTVDPFSCKLGWTVKLDNREFLGADALRQIDPKNPPQYFVGLKLEGRAIARHDQTVLVNGVPRGRVTSGTFSFTLGHPIATAYLSQGVESSDEITVEIRGQQAPAQQVSLPFYRRRIAVPGGR